MPRKPIAIASDHGGYTLKSALVREIERRGLGVLDLGCHSTDSVDYPEYADAMARVLAAGEAEFGVLVCGTGIGISIAANRHPHVRAALCHNTETARLARAHNDANVLALGGRVLDEDTARACLGVFLETPFEGGRHARRVARLTEPAHI